MALFNVYACGGAAANIVKKLNNVDCNKLFVDTSTSNLKGVPKENIFLVEDMEGAGKYRKVTYDLYKDYNTDVLVKVKPSANMNIVISSLSGGSGSVVAPLLVSELLKQGHPVVAIGIGTNNSVIEIKNTLSTLKSYKGVSSATSKCVALYYVDNEARSHADHDVPVFVNVLSVLFDKSNTEEIDRTDIANFINFDKVTDNQPTVGIVSMTANVPVIPQSGTTIVSSIFVTDNKEELMEPVKPEYLATCIVTDKTFEESFRINNTLGQLNVIVNKLEEELQGLLDNKTLNRYKEIEVHGNEDGLVI